MPGGRRSKPVEERVYTDGRRIQDIALAVFARMQAGESLRQACEAEGTFHSAVLQWADQSEEIAYHYARARHGLISARAAELRRIAEEVEPDPAHVAKARLLVDTLKWELSKLAPKTFGDRTTLAGDPKAPVSIQVITGLPE